MSLNMLLITISLLVFTTVSMVMSPVRDIIPALPTVALVFTTLGLLIRGTGRKKDKDHNS